MRTFTAREIVARFTATAIQAGTAAVIASGVLDADTGTAALVAVLTAVLTLAHRLASGWLEAKGEIDWTITPR